MSVVEPSRNAGFIFSHSRVVQTSHCGVSTNSHPRLHRRSTLRLYDSLTLSVQTEHAPSLHAQIINFQIFRFPSSPLGWALRSARSIRCCKYKNNRTNRKCFKTCICAKKHAGEHKTLIFKRKHLMHKTGFNIFRLKCF